MNNIKEKIIAFAKNKESFTTGNIVECFSNKFTRQYLSKILNNLVSEGLLIKTGSTRNSAYALASGHNILKHSLSIRLKNLDLAEDQVLNKIEEKYDWLNDFEDNAGSIFYYAFTEMLNNAIEHSLTKNIDISITKTNNSLVFVVRDFGIGVFRNVMNKRKLKNELESIQDILKGKTTTEPKSHSGEGIFFTSKAGDCFELESYGLRLRVDNQIKDFFIEDISPEIKGTRVIFSLKLPTARHLNKIFEKFQSNPENFAFDATEIKVKLYTLGGIYISRSQARRILSGLDKFKTITLDFDQVPTVGQAFADEIFRVFKIKYPDIDIIPINMNKTVAFMVGRVAKD